MVQPVLLDEMNSLLEEARQKMQKSMPKGNENQTEESVQVVEFLLESDLYAFNLFEVKEVVEYVRITKLPNTSACIKGIIDLRGEITTIIDIKRILGISSKKGSSANKLTDSRIIVLDNRITRSKIGVIVDDVLAVSTYQKSQIDKSMQSGGEKEQITGIIKKKVIENGTEKTDLVLWISVAGLLKSL